ncbi:MAG: thioredoxin family protein [Planctomycetales bacterium]|nr:thioredoxin family protein [Planctomycetales bacterium]
MRLVRLRSLPTLGFLAAASLATAALAPARAQLPDFGGFGGFGGQDEGSATVTAQFTRATDERPALLFVTAELSPGFHIYAVDQGALADGGGPQKTKITITAPGVKQLGPFQPLAAPHSRIDKEAFIGLELREHDDVVTWFAPVELPAGADPATLKITGNVDAQICDANNCIPVEADFAAALGKGFDLPAGVEIIKSAPAERGAVGSSPLDVTPAKPKAAAPPVELSIGSAGTAALQGGPDYDISQIELGESNDESLLYYLLTALAGGVILNVMPCVLPVIGLKVMSFVQQAGESRARALVLNLWYSAGIIAVFLGLATFAVVARVGWGEQFASPWFNVVLLSVIYAMALSMLGVWEVPIPGFAGTGAAIEMAEREGPAAAFLKGILTTLLATPCTAPLMASALAWAVRQPGWVAYAVFGAMGLGMAAPYLLVGAFPGLIRFLPKPGMWMETFKKTMGLVLMGTVVWFLTFLASPLVVPTIALMLAIGAACWWISLTPNYEPLGKRLLAWTQAGLFTVVAAMACFGLLYQKVMLPRYEEEIAARVQRSVRGEKLAMLESLSHVNTSADLQTLANDLTASLYDADQAWQPFDLRRLGSVVLGQQKTVLVDFTADWCPNCKVLESTVLKSDEVEQALAQAGVVTMVADYTHRPQWMRETLDALQSTGIPVTAIFPADRPYAPIVLRGLYGKATLLEQLQSLEKTRTAALPSLGR